MIKAQQGERGSEGESEGREEQSRWEAALDAAQVPAERRSQLGPSVVQLGATGGRCVVSKNSIHPSEAPARSDESGFFFFPECQGQKGTAATRFACNKKKFVLGGYYTVKVGSS